MDIIWNHSDNYGLWIPIDFCPLLLPTAFLVCTIVGITVGSSFTTISTIGIAFLGIGHILGFNDAMTTGAVVSGAFLGNNCSPLSDTTNLAAGIGEVNLFEHIAGMRYTDLPAFVISMLFYFFLVIVVTQLIFKQLLR